MPGLVHRASLPSLLTVLLSPTTTPLAHHGTQPAGPSPRWRSHGLALSLQTTAGTCTPQAPLPLGWTLRTPRSESLGEVIKWGHASCGQPSLRAAPALSLGVSQHLQALSP